MAEWCTTCISCRPRSPPNPRANGTSTTFSRPSPAIRHSARWRKGAAPTSRDKVVDAAGFSPRRQGWRGRRRSHPSNQRALSPEPWLEDHPVRARALVGVHVHLETSPAHVAGDHRGEHWLATFAHLALEG